MNIKRVCPPRGVLRFEVRRMRASRNKPNYTTMKTKLFNLLGANLLGALMVAPMALAGPSFPFPPFPGAKSPSGIRDAVTAPKAHPAACCAAHNVCKGIECCYVKRAYYTPASGRGLAWNEVRGCKTSCPLDASSKRAVCGMGKGV